MLMDMDGDGTVARDPWTQLMNEAQDPRGSEVSAILVGWIL